MAGESHKVVSHDEWIEARKQLLDKEKEYTRLGDRLARERRELPWERVTKDYEFDGPAGREKLSELFAGRSQLAVYHFMFNPAWEAGCPHCSFWADNFDGIDVHLAHRDVSFVVISHAPLDKVEAFKKRLQACSSDSTWECWSTRALACGSQQGLPRAVDVSMRSPN